MASQKVERRALQAAALEGFAAIEERQAKKPPGKAQNIPNHQKNEVAAIINCKDAAQRYGGLVIEPVITSDKAARRYGGVVVEPAVTSDKAVQRYGGVLITNSPRDKTSRT